MQNLTSNLIERDLFGIAGGMGQGGIMIDGRMPYTSSAADH